MPPVKPRRIGPQKPFHAIDQVGLRRFHHGMEVIAHQTIGMHQRGRPLGPWSTRKNVIAPIFLSPVLPQLVARFCAGQIEPAFSLSDSDACREPKLIEAIRSVSHLDLAPCGEDDRKKPYFRTERSGPDLVRPNSLRLGFWSTVLLPRVLALASARVHQPLRPSRLRQDQKTFSAGPRSFSAIELWFPSQPCGCVQGPTRY